MDQDATTVVLTPTHQAWLDREAKCLEAGTQLTLAKTDTWIAGCNGLAAGIMALAGSPAFIVAAIPAAIYVGTALHHLGKGIQLAKDANNPDSLIRDPELQGRITDTPQLSPAA